MPAPTTRLLTLYRFLFRRADIILPLLFLVGLLLFQPRFALDSTLMAALGTWEVPSHETVYTGYLLSHPLSWLRDILPAVAWYTAAWYLAAMVSVIIWSRFLVRAPGGDIGWKHLFSLALVLIFIVNFLSLFYYFLCGASCMAAAYILLAHSLRQRRPFLLLLAAALFLFGASIRWDAAPAAIPLLACLLLHFAFDRKWKECLAPLTACLLAAGVYILQPLCSNTTMWDAQPGAPAQNLVRINNIRSSFCDYKDARHQEKLPEYRELGVSDNDLTLLGWFFYWDERRTDSAWWEKLKAIRDRDNERLPLLNPGLLARRILEPGEYVQLAYTRYRAFKDIPLMALSLIAFAALPLRRRWNDARNWLALGAAADVLLMLATGRVTCASLWSAYLLAAPLVLAATPGTPLHPGKGCTLAITAYILLLAAAFAYSIRRSYSPFALHYMAPHERQLVLDECRCHPENMYFCDTVTWGNTIFPSSSLLSQPYKEPQNLICINGWQGLSPVYHQELRKRGVDSDTALLLHGNHRLIVIGDGEPTDTFKLLGTYHREQHGITITPVLERDLGGVRVYRFEQ